MPKAKSKDLISLTFDVFSDMRQAAGQMDLRYHQFLSTKGITLTQYLILNALSKESPLTPLHLADELCVSPASITYTCRTLMKKKLVMKKTDPTDRRSMRITLTASGRTKVRSLVRSLNTLTKEFFGDLSEREVSQLSKISCRVRSKLPMMTPTFR